MAEDIPWTWTELGEDSRDHREARRVLHESREQQLYGQEIDARIIGFVWICPPALTGALVEADLTDVGWLDDFAIEHEGVVPILNLDYMELGVGARGGEFVAMYDTHEEPVELAWVWERILEAGLKRLGIALSEGRAEPAALFDESGLREDELFRELGELGGVALVDFARGLVGL